VLGRVRWLWDNAGENMSSELGLQFDLKLVSVAGVGFKGRENLTVDFRPLKNTFLGFWLPRF
jgi:hypothetical protein